MIGKPNSGKSTFFSAATLMDVEIANYPFTTINPNVGVAYVSIPCVCKEFKVRDNPVNSICMDGVRYALVKLVDVAGLIPGAYKGQGLGNKFLDDIRRADVLIHVVDASGSTNERGLSVEPGSHDPVFDVGFVEKEYELWMSGIIKRDWRRIRNIPDKRTAITEIARRLSGLGVREHDVVNVLKETGLHSREFSSWGDRELSLFVSTLRRRNKPILVAANKVDEPTAGRNLERLGKSGVDYVPTSALSELVLRRAAKTGLVRYRPGDTDFEITNPGLLDDKKRRALELIRERVLRVYGGTGVQEALNKSVFSLLGVVAVYPVEDEHKLTDSEGRVLPDVYLVKRGTTVRELAYMIHTDLGESFIHAVRVRDKSRVGGDYVLRHGDVVKIVQRR